MAGLWMWRAFVLFHGLSDWPRSSCLRPFVSMAVQACNTALSSLAACMRGYVTRLFSSHPRQHP
jgi:hypothetical protein